MQSIIVYRSPFEAAMWEGIMSGSFFPVIVGVVVFFTVFLVLNRLVVNRYWSWYNSGWPTNIALAISAIIGIATIFYMA